MVRVERTTAKPALARPKRRLSKAFWFRVHSAIGLNLAMLLAFVFATGTLSVFSFEIDWLIKPAMRASPATPIDETDWTAVVAAAAAAAPDGAIETIETGPSAIFAPTAFVRRADGGLTPYYFDPRTGEFQGAGRMLGAKSLLRAIHSRLTLGDRIGVLIVSSLSLLLLTSLVTAMLFHRKWWRGLAAIPRRRKSKRGFWGDVHRFAGAWGLIFGLLVAATALVYLSEKTIGGAPGFGESDFAGSADNEAAARGFPAAQAIARAQYPDLRIRRIDWPGERGAGFVFYGQDGTLLVRPQANGIGIGIEDGGDGKTRVAFRHSGSEAGLHRRLIEAADPVHMGKWGGYPSRIAWFLFGATMTGLAVSGAMVAGRRLTMGKPGAERASGRWAALGALRGMAGGAVLLAAALVVVAINLPSEIAWLR